MKLILIISVLYFSSCAQATSSNSTNDDNIEKFLKFLWDCLEGIASKVHLHPDTGLSIDQFLEKYSYPLEYHNVTTSDNFILTMHRIPHEGNKKIEEVNDDTTKPVVFLVHGMTSSSMDWIVQGPNTSLALILADLGYDVWIANLRGNTFTSHTTLTRKDAAFWEYSFHERGYLDLPACIDYIIKATGVKTITYVGHSEGTTNGLVLASTKTDYNEKINLMALLSPVVYMGNLTSPLVQLIGKNEKIFELVMTALGIHGLEYSPLITLLADVFCNDDSSLQGLCIAALSLAVGFDIDEFDRSMITVYLSHMPSGVSVKEAGHYLQEYASGYFRQYDYGTLGNQIHYGSKTPPEYDIGKVTLPLAFYYAKNDFMSSVLDVERLIHQLNVDTADKYLVEYEFFNHLDFLIAKDVKALLYDRVTDTIQKYNPLPTN